MKPLVVLLSFAASSKNLLGDDLRFITSYSIMLQMDLTYLLDSFFELLIIIAATMSFATYLRHFTMRGVSADRHRTKKLFIIIPPFLVRISGYRLHYTVKPSIWLYHCLLIFDAQAGWLLGYISYKVMAVYAMAFLLLIKRNERIKRDMEGIKDYYTNVRECIDRYNIILDKAYCCKDELDDQELEFLDNHSLYLAHALLKDFGPDGKSREALSKMADVISDMV